MGHNLVIQTGETCMRSQYQKLGNWEPSHHFPEVNPPRKFVSRWQVAGPYGCILNSSKLKVYANNNYNLDSYYR
jgi:hypothetical protein